MARDRARSRALPKKLNKSAWIRCQPATLSASDVMKKAKAEGKLAWNYGFRAVEEATQALKRSAGL